jgi:hypothetical protein
LMRRQPYPDTTTGVSVTKRVFHVHKCAAIHFGKMRRQPSCTLHLREQPNGKLVPYLRFKGANLELTKSGIDLLGSLR